MDTPIEETNDLFVDETLLSEMEQFYDEMNDEIDAAFERGARHDGSTCSKTMETQDSTITEDALDALLMADYILDKYGALKEYCNSPYMNADDTKWFNYVSRALRCQYHKCSDLKATDEKALYRNIIMQAQAHHLPETLIFDLSSVLMEYIYAGSSAPIIFHGKPGCGKTEAAKIIAKILTIPYYQISSPAVEHGHGMLGEGAYFKSADCGELWKGILHTQVLNPVYIIEEIDKISHLYDRIALDEELLTVLNDDSRLVPDNFMEFPASLKRSFIIFTCNDIEKVSAPLRDRCLIISFPEVNRQQLLSILNEYSQQLVKGFYHDRVVFSSSTIEHAADMLLSKGVTSIRQHKQMIERICRCAYREYLQSNKSKVDVSFEMLRYSSIPLLAEIAKKIGF